MNLVLRSLSGLFNFEREAVEREAIECEALNIGIKEQLNKRTFERKALNLEHLNKRTFEQANI